MKNKKKVEGAVALCTANDFHIPEGSSANAEIRKIGFNQGIKTRAHMKSFIASVKYRLKKHRKISEEEFGGVPNKWYKLLLFSVIFSTIAIIFALFETMFAGAQSLTMEPHIRVCLTLYKITFPDEYFVKTSDD